MATAPRRDNGFSADPERELTSALAAPAGAQPTLRAEQGPSQVIADVGRYAQALSSTGGRLHSVRPPKGGLYVNVSHFGLGHQRLLQGLAARGVKPVIMLHDLIPIRYPEYCTAGTDRRHIHRVLGMIDHASLVIANSQSTADDLADYAAAMGRAAPPTCVASLGLETAFLERPADPVAGQPYFVCVGTIEPRKNLAFLLALWRRLSCDLGERTPQLVLVGRRGWENESVIDHIERSPPVVRYVHEVNSLQDGQLARLIAGATALLAPSFAEGFDLPVAEALALSTPVIASDIPVHRELAGDAALVDPLDGPGWLAAIKAALEPSRNPPTPRAPTWERHFAIVGAALGIGRG